MGGDTHLLCELSLDDVTPHWAHVSVPEKGWSPPKEENHHRQRLVIIFKMLPSSAQA